MSKKPELDNITLPVYEVCHKELEDSKNILSQIVYDTTDDTAIFPKGIVPLKVWDDSIEQYVYFDYTHTNLVDQNNNPIANSILLFVENGIKYDNGAVPPNISELVYINFDGLDSTLDFNTYYIFKPITSAGTKLYKHTIGYGTLPNRQEIIFISTGNGNGTQPYVDLLNNIGEILKIIHLYYISENMQKESTDVIVPGILNGSFPYVIGTLILWNNTSSAFEKTVINLFSHGTTVTHTVEEL